MNNIPENEFLSFVLKQMSKFFNMSIFKQDIAAVLLYQLKVDWAFVLKFEYMDSNYFMKLDYVKLYSRSISVVEMIHYKTAC